MQKEISILREVLKDSVLTPAERQSIYRQLADLEQKLEAVKLEQAVARLGAMCKHIDEGKRPLPCGGSQSHIGFHIR